MKILHYTLGLPPYRTGGLTKYSFDLMKSQIMENNIVILLYPGHFDRNSETKIISNSFYDMAIYELINPLPVPLLGGISNPELFCKKVDEKIYLDFLTQIKPDIIHVHTLMGIHKEFFVAAKDLDIKITYTTHDYFGICPTVNLIDFEGNICNDYEKGRKCVICNKNAYDIKLIEFMQSRLYRSAKSFPLIKYLKKFAKSYLKGIQISNNRNMDLCNEEIDIKAKKFVDLREYYFNILSLIDYFHFNSSVAKKVFQSYININGKVINITHLDIKDHRQKKIFDNNKPLKITYLGPLTEQKGFRLLKKSLDNLMSIYETNWILDVYGDDSYIGRSEYDKKRYRFHGGYNYQQLRSIFNETDLLIVPSIWYETFGFVGLEALSYGVPVAVSENVGMKDLIKDKKTGLIFEPNENELTNLLLEIIRNRDILNNINENICNDNYKFDMWEHTQKILELYKSVLKERY